MCILKNVKNNKKKKVEMWNLKIIKKEIFENCGSCKNVKL
jgi:hypothetical protein